MAVSMVPALTAAPVLADPGCYMDGAVTGWTWQWNYVVSGLTPEGRQIAGQPYNTNTRNSIMVVYDCWVYPENFEGYHFEVDYTRRQMGRVMNVLNEVPESVEVYEWCEWGPCDSVVFLTLSNPMATDATPTVTLVEDETGAVIDEVVAIDGIAPLLELEVVGDPYGMECFEVIATASEPISEAYIYTVTDDLPEIRHFPARMPDKDEYGGYCYSNFSTFIWAPPYDWRVADAIEDDNVAYWQFCPYQQSDPQDTFFVEVAAHDYTICDTPWWMHEKWYVESMFLQGKDTIVIHLWEGWNLISFPRTPVDPTLSEVFADMGVTRVYTYENYRWYGSMYDTESGRWFTPRGLRGLSRVKAGVGYWVYCSPPGDEPWYIEAIEEMASDYLNYEARIDVRWNDLVVEVEPTGTAGMVPPTYRVSRGWNLVGVPVLGDLDLMEMHAQRGVTPGPAVTSHVPLTYVSDFLSGLDWRALFWYLPPVTARYKVIGAGGPGWMKNTITWPGGYLGTTPGSSQTSNWNVGFWLSSFGSLGLPLGMYGEPGVYGSEDDYVGVFCCDMMSPEDFMSDFDGYTEAGDYIEGMLYGQITDMGLMGLETSGVVEGEIEHDTPDGTVYEYFMGTTTGYVEMIGMTIGGTFTGITDWGRTIEGTYGGVGVFDECDFEGSMQGTITDTGLLGDVEFDNGIVQDTNPVVMPGYGYWVYFDSPGVLIPVR